MGGDALADRGDALQLLPAARIGRSCGQLAGALGVPPGEADQRLRGDAHRLELLLPGVGLRVVQVVQGGQARVDPGDEVHHAFVIDLAVQDGVAGGALLHELGEDARLVGRDPFRRHLLQDPLAHGLAPPEGDDRLRVDLRSLRADGERDLLPRVEDVQIGQGVAAQLRVGGRGFGGRPLLPDDQLVVLDANGLVLQQPGEGPRPLHRDGARLRLLLVKAGHEQGALRGERGPRFQAALAEPGDAIGHGHRLHPPIFTGKPKASSRRWSAAICAAGGGSMGGSGLGRARRAYLSAPMRW